MSNVNCLDWILIENGVLVQIFRNEFTYLNQNCQEESTYNFSVLGDEISTSIGTRKSNITESQILIAIKKWLISKNEEIESRISYTAFRNKLMNAWCKDATRAVLMAKQIKHKKTLEECINSWRHECTPYEQEIKEKGRKVALENSLCLILRSVDWISQNRESLAGSVNLKKDVDSWVYQEMINLPLSEIRELVISQLRRVEKSKGVQPIV